MMDVWCEICGRRWDSLDFGIRPVQGGERWECTDEAACMETRSALLTVPASAGSAQRMYPRAWARDVPASCICEWWWSDFHSRYVRAEGHSGCPWHGVRGL